MAAEIKLGYLDEEFRKTAMGRTQKRQSDYVKNQQEAIRNLNVPSQYLKMAQQHVESLMKGQRDTQSSIQKKAEGAVQPGQGGGVATALLSRPGYSEAQTMTVVRDVLKGKGKTGTLLGG